jgi:hypothetical protein
MIHFAKDSGTGLQMISAKTSVGIERLDFKIRELAQKFSNKIPMSVLSRQGCHARVSPSKVYPRCRPL